MALNMADKLGLAKEILPEVEFMVHADGVKVYSYDRLAVPRFVPFDNIGKVDLDYAISKEGVTLHCKRFKGTRFIPFDRVHDLPGHCFFKVF
jgi:hypothetical protein